MKKLLVTFIVALFATVVLGQTKTELKPGDLPNCVKDYIHHNFKDFIVDKAFRIENKLEGSFEVTIMNGKDKQTLNFDDKCNAVKKINLNQKQKPEPKPLPPVKAPAKGPAKVKTPATSTTAPEAAPKK